MRTQKHKKLSFILDGNNLRLDVFLSQKMYGESRSEIQKMIKSGDVFVNSKPTKAGVTLKRGDKIDVFVDGENTESEILKPQKKVILPVLYEDKDVAVLDKPPGLVVSKSEDSLFADFDSDKFLVHRLDKDTSGIFVTAKNAEARAILSKQFADRVVKKRYTALVYGHLKPLRGTIEAGIGRSLKDRKKMSVFSNKLRNAVTHYKVIRYYGPCSLLDVEIETGRTHQIRVHLASIGFPVAGDKTYGNKFANVEFDRKYGLKRQFLHAHLIDFVLPSTGKNKSVESKLSADLKSVLDKIL
ncbi:MAG: RluA family pseudouridine synthase [Candidatus Gracilibacteria bacterium]